MDDDEIEVVRPTPEDWERVRAIRLAALADAPDAFGTTLAEDAAQPPSWWQGRLRSEAVTLLARWRGRDVGLAVVAPAGGGDGGLYAVWVAPDGRGRGVGDALVQAAIAAATERGYPRLVLDVGDHNVHAQRLYARWGFVRTGRRGALPPPREHVGEHELARALRPDPGEVPPESG